MAGSGTRSNFAKAPLMHGRLSDRGFRRARLAPAAGMLDLKDHGRFREPGDPRPRRTLAQGAVVRCKRLRRVRQLTPNLVPHTCLATDQFALRDWARHSRGLSTPGRGKPTPHNRDSKAVGRKRRGSR